MTILQNDFDRERIPVRRLAWYENVRREKKKKYIFLKKPFTVTVVQRKPSDSEGVWWEALIDFSDTLLRKALF